MFFLQPIACRVILASICTLFGAFSLLCARAGYLSEKNTPEAAAAAAQLLPFNALYYRQLAYWQPTRKVELLKRAIELNRYDAESWIQLGFNAELQQKNTTLAERYFLTAAQVDHMYLPSWTLASFYFRRQNSPQLFEWASRALKVTPYDSTYVFVTLWLADPDPVRIAGIVPPREQVMLEYVSFLIQTNRLDLAQRVLNRAISLSPSRPPVSEFYKGPLDTHSSVLLDRLLQLDRVQQALHLWSRLAAANWIPRFSTPSALHPLTNGNFQVPFFGHGFDWQVSPVSGVTVDQFPDLGDVRFKFSGTQPEACLLIQQLVPLEKGGHYRLTWADDLDQIEGDNGITWQIYTIANGVPMPTGLTSPDLTSVAGSPAAWNFQAPHSSDLFLLSLQYARPLGQVRIEGSLSLRNVALHALQ
jgi:hypothetical protein